MFLGLLGEIRMLYIKATPEHLSPLIINWLNNWRSHKNNGAQTFSLKIFNNKRSLWAYCKSAHHLKRTDFIVYRISTPREKKNRTLIFRYLARKKHEYQLRRSQERLRFFFPIILTIYSDSNSLKKKKLFKKMSVKGSPYTPGFFSLTAVLLSQLPKYWDRKHPPSNLYLLSWFPCFLQATAWARHGATHSESTHLKCGEWRVQSHPPPRHKGKTSYRRPRLERQGRSIRFCHRALSNTGQRPCLCYSSHTLAA